MKKKKVQVKDWKFVRPMLIINTTRAELKWLESLMADPQTSNDEQIARKAWLNHMAEEKNKARRAERIILALALIGALATGYFGAMAVVTACKTYAASLRSQ